MDTLSIVKVIIPNTPDYVMSSSGAHYAKGKNNCH